MTPRLPCTAPTFLWRNHVSHGPASRLAHRALLAAVLSPALLLTGGVAAHSATAAELSDTTGWIRFAHLSPDTPEVDVRLTSFAGSEQVLLEDVGYGALSDFESVPVGSYNASMVPADSPAGTVPMLSATLRVEEGQAYSALAVGLQDDIAVEVLRDDLTPPPQGQARVRLVQASNAAPVVDVSAQGGPVLAAGARFPTATGYADVPAGQWTVAVEPVQGDVETATAAVQLEAGSVHTLLVLDDPEGGLTVRTAVDSESMPQMPIRGVDTGAGGSSEAAGARTGALGGTTLAAAGLGVAAALGLASPRLARLRPERRAPSR